MAQSLSIKNDMLSIRVFLSAYLCLFPSPLGVTGPTTRDNTTATPSFFVRFFIMSRQSQEGVYIRFFFLYIISIALRMIVPSDYAGTILPPRFTSEEVPVPRPKKIRHCEGQRCGKAFKPTRVPLAELKHIPLLQDELEALRLCDLQCLTQEQAGHRMGISRGTVQRILTSARRKVAQALVEDAALIIEDSAASPIE